MSLISFTLKGSDANVIFNLKESITLSLLVSKLSNYYIIFYNTLTIGTDKTLS
jgi:hypothetical protein